MGYDVSWLDTIVVTIQTVSSILVKMKELEYHRVSGKRPRKVKDTSFLSIVFTSTPFLSVWVCRK